MLDREVQWKMGRGRMRLWALGLSLLLIAGSAAAQSSEYTIGIGDELEVTVWQREDLGGTVRVDTEGNVTLPLIGAIRAAGQTPRRLQDELTRRFSFVDREVSQVTIVVLEYNSRRIFVMGGVAEPGTYSFPQIPGVWEVIREAGGPSADAALSRVKIIPAEGSGPPNVIDLELALATGDFSLLPILLPGTTIMVPRSETIGIEGDVVYLNGAVANPGPLSIDTASNLVEAILSAGGPAEGADVRNIRVVRPGPVQARVFKVNLEDYTHRGELFPNLALRPGDTVTVPASTRSATWETFKEVAGIATGILTTVFLFDRASD